MRSEPGLDSFWSTVGECSRQALAAGALQPISTDVSEIEHHRVRFTVRVSRNLLRKPDSNTSYYRTASANPFHPPEPALTVGALPPGHIAVLNKFNVLRDHVLVITRDFVHQETPLTAADFEALVPGLHRGTGLAFYNAGKTAGASQPHRHFQLVPPDLGSGPGIPTETLLTGAADGIDTIGDFRFRHTFARVPAATTDAPAFGRCCRDLYERALVDLGMVTTAPEAGTRLPSYNLLLTDRWMLVIPRAREHCLDISVNGLGYAGSLFVSSREKLDQARAIGPMRILDRVSMSST